MNARDFLPLALVTTAVGLTAGCFSPRADATRFYVLGDATDLVAKAPAATCARMVLVGPVRVATHVDQPVIVERVGANEVRLLEWQRWAELPGRALPSALVTRLAAGLPDVCVVSYARATPGTNSVQVEIEIERFELRAENQAVLAARWRIFTPGAGGKGAQHSGRYEQSFAGGTNRVAAGVAALTETVDRLAKQLADDLRAQ